MPMSWRGLMVPVGALACLALAGFAGPVRADEPLQPPATSLPGEPVPSPDPAATPPMPPPPSAPTGLAVTGGTFRSGTVDWDDLPGATTYNVQLAQSAGMDGAEEFAAAQSTATVFRTRS